MKLFGVAFLGSILTLIRILSGFLISKFIAVYAGPVGMALLGQLQNFIGILNGVVINQLSQGVVRYSAENQKAGINFCAPWWKATTSIVIFLLLIILPIVLIFNSTLSLWLFSSSDYGWIIVVACLALPLNAANAFFLGVLTGFGQNKKNITSSMLSILITLVLTFLFLYFFGVIGGLFLAAISNAISAIVVLFRVRNEPWFKFCYWFGKVNPDNRKKLLGYVFVGLIGALTGPSALIVVRNLIIDNYSMVDAGIWQSAVRVSDAFVSFCTLGVGMYFFPKAASISNRNELLDITFKVLKFLVPIALAGFCFIYFLRDIILTILFTDSFIQASDLLLSRLVGDTFRIIAFVPACILLAKGYFKVNAIVEIMMNVILVIGSYLLIDVIGVKGINYAYSISYLLYFIFSFSFFFYHCKKLDEVDIGRI